MKIKKVGVLLLCVAMLFAFASCSKDDGYSKDNTPTEKNENFGPLAEKVKTAWDELYDYGTLTVGGVGDTLSNEFFDWKVNSVKTAETISGKSAGAGYKYVIVNITAKNTTDENYEFGGSDFLGIIGDGESDEVDTESKFYDDMLADQSQLDAGKSISGDVVFKVKSSVDEILVDYEEFFGDGSTGDTNWFDLKL